MFLLTNNCTKKINLSTLSGFKDLCHPSTLDLDHCAFNLRVNDDLSILQQLFGQTVVLANPKIRKCDRSVYSSCDFETLVLADHQVILEISATREVKEDVCKYFSSNGHMSIPSDANKDYLTQGCTKYPFQRNYLSSAWCICARLS